MSRHLREVIDQEKDDESPDLFEGDWVMFGATRRMNTRKGVILYSQNTSRNGGEYGVVFGFQASEPYKKGRRNTVRFVKVRPLTAAEQKSYKGHLRRRLIGEINFW